MPKNPYNLTPQTLKGRIPMVSGDVIFVDSATGTSNADGSSLRPYSTVKNAFAKSGLSTGDIIICMPGHAEAISASTSLTANVAGIRVISQGRGSQRATFTYGSLTTATIAISAANISFENCLFVCNLANTVAAFTLTTANDFALIDCELRDAASNKSFINIIDTNATSNDADGLSMIRTKWLGLANVTATTVIKMDGTNDRLYVEDCYFAHKNVDDGGLFMIIAAGKVLTNMEVKNSRMNFVGVSSASAGVLITTDGSTNSGYFDNVKVKHLDTTSEIMVTASSGFVFFDLKATAVADKNAYFVPGQDS